MAGTSTPSTGGPLHVEDFWSDGRGPETHRVIWNATGTSIRAIEYLNPDWTDIDSDLRHVILERPQAVLITPEEVIGSDQLGDRYNELGPAAMFDLGRSAWLESFGQTHLANCRHIQLLFYDEVIDVLCEGVRCGKGRFTDEPGDEGRPA